MDVHIDELHSSVESVGAEALLSPEVLERIVAAVRAALDRSAGLERARAADLDTRSLVERQRAGGR
jgi:hypothetical protein